MSKAYFRKLLAAFVCCASFIYFGAITFCTVPQANMDNVKIILGFLLGSAVGLVLGYYFGDAESKTE